MIYHVRTDFTRSPVIVLRIPVIILIMPVIIPRMQSTLGKFYDINYRNLLESKSLLYESFLNKMMSVEQK